MFGSSKKTLTLIWSKYREEKVKFYLSKFPFFLNLELNISGLSLSKNYILSLRKTSLEVRKIYFYFISFKLGSSQKIKYVTFILHYIKDLRYDYFLTLKIEFVQITMQKKKKKRFIFGWCFTDIIKSDWENH